MTERERDGLTDALPGARVRGAADDAADAVRAQPEIGGDRPRGDAVHPDGSTEPVTGPDPTDPPGPLGPNRPAPAAPAPAAEPSFVPAFRDAWDAWSDSRFWHVRREHRSGRVGTVRAWTCG